MSSSIVSAPMVSHLVSVIIPSFQRPKALLELLQRLGAQTYGHFEVVVIEQSQNDALLEKIAALGDPRIRVFARPPLSLPAARNEGIRLSRGEILIFIDDDDLPIGDDWIARHQRNFSDPNCLGVAGRWCIAPEGDPPPRFPRLVRSAAFTYTLFKDPIAFAFGSLRKEGISFILFTNGSIRRSVFNRVGGFDEGIHWGEEHPLFFKLAPQMKPGEYFVFDPAAAIWHRSIFKGGLNRRGFGDWHLRELRNRVRYQHAVVGHYFPLRFLTLYPLFLLRVLFLTESFIWDESNRERTTYARIKAMLEVLLHFPRILYREGWKLPADAVRRVPEI